MNTDLKSAEDIYKIQRDWEMRMKDYIIAVWEREIGRLHREYDDVRDSATATGNDMRTGLERKAIEDKFTVARAQLKAAQES